MRIVGGIWRGRALEAPCGRDVTRPTTDRVREAITSSLVSAAGLDLTHLHVLDAFAGSGAMGIELASRGAAQVTLVEKNRRVGQTIRKNLSSLQNPPSVRLQLGDCFALAVAGRLAGAPFDIVVLDPPYATSAQAVAKLVDDLGSSRQLNVGALVLYERADKNEGLLEHLHEPFELLGTKRYGSTATDLLKYVGKELCKRELLMQHKARPACSLQLRTWWCRVPSIR